MIFINFKGMPPNSRKVSFAVQFKMEKCFSVKSIVYKVISEKSDKSAFTQ